jgi:hypothetical protein
MRRRSRSKFGTPYIWHLIVLMRFKETDGDARTDTAQLTPLVRWEEL